MAIDDDELVPLTAELHVRDLDASVAYWRDVLGFEVSRHDPDFAVLFDRSSSGDAMVMLAPSHEDTPELRPGDPERGLGLHLRVTVDDVDAHFERARAAGAEIIFAPTDQPYGLRDYMLRVPDGFYVRFARGLTSGH